jgi:AraC-like DNA-binding protein
MPTTFPAFRLDFFVLFIALGIGQGLFLSWFFIRQKQWAHRYYGLAVLVLAILLIDIWLSYSNLIFQALYLVDFSEPLNFVIAPLLYLSLRSHLRGKAGPWVILHFLPALLYLLYALIALYFLPLPYKYNSHLDAWAPELTRLALDYRGMDWRFSLQHSIDEAMLIQMGLYLFYCFWELNRAFDHAGLGFWSSQQQQYNWLRRLLIASLLVFLTLLITKSVFSNDHGDPYTGVLVAALIYLNSANLLRSSSLFKQMEAPKARYERSSLNPADLKDIIARLQALFEAEKPFLDPNFSLNRLAKALKVPNHHLSQALNEELGLGFFELCAKYRIETAKELLSTAEYAQVTIEEIAENVGYNSKSAFNSAFKKWSGTTPSLFRKTMGGTGR